MNVAARVESLISPLSVAWRIRISLFCGLVLINTVGAGLVFFLTAYVVPLPVDLDELYVHRNLALLGLMIPAFLMAGVIWGWILLQPTAQWLGESRRPYPEEQRWLLATPRRMFFMHAAMWSAGMVVFGTFNADLSVELGFVVALIIGLSGMTASSVAYLITERLLRNLARRALREGVPERLRVRSVAMRTMFAWVLGSGVPVLGLTIVGFRALTGRDTSTEQLATTMLVVGVMAFVIGGLTTYAAARASSDPIRGLRQAFARVSHGNLNAEVQIYDGTEIGLLQAGFNEMVAGLRERERMRDLFGRHVGGDVARSALEGGVRLGGEARHVGVLFVDIIGSTTIAQQRHPEEVVALLNRFFDVVIEVVHQHEGWINKFEGDAALAVWGAPLGVVDMEAKVLAAGRELGIRLATELTDLSAGIGISAGTAVAGNVGASERYEYTVIGDPVNEASRLSELAKKFQGHVVANAVLLDSAGTEAEAWEERKAVTVRGRKNETRIAVPVD